MTKQENKDSPRGPGSFCIPRTVLEALLDAKATAYEICAYLVLARFTDETGRYSTASISAVNRYTGANKVKGGPVDRAIERLKTIHARRKEKVSKGRSGKSHQMVERFVDLGPILSDRDTWCAQTGEVLPDGPTERSKVLFVLHHFDESVEDRIWFGGNLVTGISEFNQPLKALKNAGDTAARLLLTMYAANDMETWGGVCPIGQLCGPWMHYKAVDKDVLLYGGARLIRAKNQGEVASIDERVSGGSKEAYWDAIRALKSAGLAYEMVLVLNRNAVKSHFNGSGDEYSAIPNDAEPFYELDCRTQHGNKPVGEEGIGGATANTADAVGYPVAVEGGRFDGTYAAIVPSGFPAMIAGIYRLRFRVSNPKNAGVKGAWARIYQNNRDAFDLIQKIRGANKLPALTPPWDTATRTRSAPKDPDSLQATGTNVAG